MVDESTPINIIFLNDYQVKSKEEVIDEYLEILKSCKSAADFYEFMSMMFDEVTMRTGNLIIQRQIRQNAETLEKLRT